MEHENIYEKASQRVKAKKGFFYHLIAYAGVLGLLYTLMLFENQGNMLPVIIVALSWGIAIASHYFKAFGTEHLEFLGFNSDWEEEALEKEIDRLTRNRELKEQLQKERMLLEDYDRLELKEIRKETLNRDFD